MSFKYYWKNQEANFGPTIKTEVRNGTHISFESILKYKRKYVALRRPQANPGHEIPQKALKSGNPHLYFVHNLPRWGQSLDTYVKQVVKDFAGVGVKKYKVIHLKMAVYKDTNQWAITPYILVEIDTLPKPGIYGNEITEVVTFTKKNVPNDFGWWSKKELEDFLNEFD